MRKLKFLKVILLLLFLFINTDLKAQVLNVLNKEIDKISKDLDKEIDNIFKTPKKAPKNKKNNQKYENEDFDVTGRWKGTCEKTVVYNFDFFLDLKQSGNKITGTAELYSSDKTIKFLVTGKVEGNILTIIEESLLEAIGVDGFYKLDFTGKIYMNNDVLTIKGKGVNTNKLYFKDNKIIKLESGTLDKSFLISKIDEVAAAEKAKKECVSGDCINGIGVKITPEGKYQGQFKDGKRNGKGRFDFYNRDRQARRYVGNFVNDTYDGYGTQYIVSDVETSKSDNYKSNIFFIKGSENEILYKVYEGNWRHNYPSGLGKMYKKGMTQLGIWNGWYLSEYEALPFEQLKQHLDSTFVKFRKCDCLTPAKISIDATGLGAVNYDIIDTESGKKVNEKTEIETVDRSYSQDGLKNNTNKIIFIKCYRKLFNVYSKRDEYRDESYTVSINQEIYKNYRHLPEAGDLIAVKEKENFIFLGQYCLKSDTTPCNNPVKKKLK